MNKDFLSMAFTIAPFVAIALCWFNVSLKNKALKYWIILIAYNSIWIVYGFWIEQLPVIIDAAMSMIIGIYGLRRFVNECKVQK